MGEAELARAPSESVCLLLSAFSQGLVKLAEPLFNFLNRSASDLNVFDSSFA